MALFGNFTYLVTSLLLVIGLYGVIAKRNLIKKLIGLSIFQTAIFLFYIHGA
ncbi:MAG: NADH-quinone oxidoreductase subunit K, partial [Candidatus Binatia bacterium]